jgi:hypothetical protein
MRLVLSLAVAALMFGVSQAAQACSCAPPPPPKKALETAAAVFVGKVTEVDRSGGFRLNVTFEVATSYKGVKAKKVTVGTASNSAACGYGFAEGESYIVYCYSPDKGKTLSTNICTRTRRASEAKADVEALGKGEAVKE